MVGTNGDCVNHRIPPNLRDAFFVLTYLISPSRPQDCRLEEIANIPMQTLTLSLPLGTRRILDLAEMQMIRFGVA